MAGVSDNWKVETLQDCFANSECIDIFRLIGQYRNLLVISFIGVKKKIKKNIEVHLNLI